MSLSWNKDEFIKNYVNANIPIPVICQCSTPTSLSLTAIQYDAKCPDCATAKRDETCIERYGYKYPMQNPEIFEKSLKSSYKQKEYTFPSGRVDLIQGYENFAIDHLLFVEKINEKDIVTGTANMPAIWYIGNDLERHKYYPDILVLPNRIIEVKSSHTTIQNEDNIYQKKKATLDLGYTYDFWLYDIKGNRLDIDDIDIDDELKEKMR
jgi:hypothetical protein